jgi:hypothetical protein
MPGGIVRACSWSRCGWRTANDERCGREGALQWHGKATGRRGLRQMEASHWSRCVSAFAEHVQCDVDAWAGPPKMKPERLIFSGLETARRCAGKTDTQTGFVFYHDMAAHR